MIGKGRDRGRTQKRGVGEYKGGKEESEEKEEE